MTGLLRIFMPNLGERFCRLLFAAVFQLVLLDGLRDTLELSLEQRFVVTLSGWMVAAVQVRG